MPDNTPPFQWTPDRSDPGPPWPVPPLATAMGRGARFLCPACGLTHAFAGYLKVVPACEACGAPLGRFRADDAPPYFTVVIVGHLLIPVLYRVETAYRTPLWVIGAIFVPAALILTLALLRPVKGATLGLMLKLNMVKTDDT